MSDNGLRQVSCLVFLKLRPQRCWRSWKRPWSPLGVGSGSPPPPSRVSPSPVGRGWRPHTAWPSDCQAGRCRAGWKECSPLGAPHPHLPCALGVVRGTRPEAGGAAVRWQQCPHHPAAPRQPPALADHHLSQLTPESHLFYAITQ